MSWHHNFPLDRWESEGGAITNEYIHRAPKNLVQEAAWNMAGEELPPEAFLNSIEKLTVGPRPSDDAPKEDYVKWCKARAYEYLEMDDPQQAFNSYVIDRNKREDTKIDVMIQGLGMMEILQGTRGVKRWIDGFPEC